jgi:hypothetical protein
METLREKSKRILKQTQSDTDGVLKAKILGTCRMDIDEEYKTIINVYSLEISDDILRISTKLENLVSDQSIRPNIRKELLDIISTLV